MKPIFGGLFKSLQLDADPPWYLGESGESVQVDAYLPWYLGDWGESVQVDAYLPWYFGEADKDHASAGFGGLNLGSKYSRLPAGDGDPR